MAKNTRTNAALLAKVKKHRSADIQDRMVKQANIDAAISHMEGHDWRSSQWAKDLDSHGGSPAVITASLLNEGGIVPPGTALKAMLEELPSVFGRPGSSITEIVTEENERFATRVLIDENNIEEAIILRVFRKVSKFPRVLWYGIDTDFPVFVRYYDGPAPSYNTPGFTPDTAAVYWEIPTRLRPRAANNDRETALTIIDLQHKEFARLLRNAAIDEIKDRRRSYMKSGLGEKLDTSDLPDQIHQVSSGEKVTHAGEITRMKTPHLGLHPIFDHSSPTIEASAPALANIMLEEICGKVVLSKPYIEDGVQYKDVIRQLPGLIDDLGDIGDKLRTAVRLIAMLHLYNSTTEMVEEKVDKKGLTFRKYKRLSAETIMKEWSQNRQLDGAVHTYPSEDSDNGAGAAFKVPAHTKELQLWPSVGAQNMQRHPITECTVCGARECLPPYQPTTVTVHVPTRIYDADGMHFEDSDQPMISTTRKVTTMTEIVSHETGLTKAVIAKAMSMFYHLLSQYRLQVLQDEGWLHGPLLENGLFYSKLHPAESGRTLAEYAYETPEGTMRMRADNFGWDEPKDYGPHLVTDEMFRGPKYGLAINWVGTAGDPMKFGDITIPVGDKAYTERAVMFHPPHEGCYMDGTITVRKMPLSEILDHTPVDNEPYIKLDPEWTPKPVEEKKSHKDILNESIAELLGDIIAGDDNN